MQRSGIQQEMERSRVTFQELVERASAEELSRRSDGTRWTNRQLLFHMVFGYLIVRTLMPLVHLLGRLGWSRRFAATLNSFRRPFHVINYLGSVGGGRLLSPAAMTRLMDQTVQALQCRLAVETEHSLNLVMHFPPAWDPYFQPIMSVLDVYHFGTQHFNHHQRQLTLQAPGPSGLGIELLVTADCPHREAAETLLRTALADVGLPAQLRVLTVTDGDDAARQGYRGSPTFRANGADLFPRQGSRSDSTAASTGPGPRRADFLTCQIWRRRWNAPPTRADRR
jgi:DinB superfamily